jgi:hypothetical protein
MSSNLDRKHDSSVIFSRVQRFEGQLRQHERADFYDGLLYAQHFVIVVEESDDRCEIDINLAGASATATVRLTSLSVTSHSQVLVEQKFQDLVLEYAMIVFYDGYCHRRTLAGQSAYHDRLSVDLDRFSDLARRIIRWS